MAPPALLAIWWGGYAFAALVAVASAIMCWEWDRIVSGRFGNPGRIGAVVCALASVLAVTQSPVAAGCVMAASVVIGLLNRNPWAIAGVLYVGLPSVALVWVRTVGDAGLETTLWLMLLVWATDIGAYAAGRMIGGPLLAPAISPKKTWAGLIGGVISAETVGAVAVVLMDLPHPPLVIIGSGLLAVVAQGGDLLESWVKRYWGVKDSSAIIPGHGGMMDRVDGLLAAGLVVALASWAGGATVLYWQ